MDKLTNLRLLTMPTRRLNESISQGFFLNFSSIEMLDMRGICLESTCFDEISSLRNLTCLLVELDSSSIFNRDHTWMSRLKRFHIVVREPVEWKPLLNWKPSLNKSSRTISITKCETFGNGELSGMLQFASDLILKECTGVRKFITYKSFDGLKSLNIIVCSRHFKPRKEGSRQFDDPLPNLERLSLVAVYKLISVSDFCQHLGLRFSRLRHLDVYDCHRLRRLFYVGGAFSVPKLLEHISVGYCDQLFELFAERCNSSVDSEIPRIRKLVLEQLPRLAGLGEPQQSMWEHLEELHVRGCNGIKKLPLSVQTSKNVKVIKGHSEWWNKLEWDDDNFKSNLQHCFQEY